MLSSFKECFFLLIAFLFFYSLLFLDLDGLVNNKITAKWYMVVLISNFGFVYLFSSKSGVCVSFFSVLFTILLLYVGIHYLLLGASIINIMVLISCIGMYFFFQEAYLHEIKFNVFF